MDSETVPERLSLSPGEALMRSMDIGNPGSSSSKIQELYDACCVLLSGSGRKFPPPVPRLDEIYWLRQILGTLHPEDVGIDSGEGSGGGSDGDDEYPNAMASSSGSEEEDASMSTSSDDGEGSNRRGMISGSKVRDITYVHIHECDEFSIGVFCFPAGAKIPLHDHPEMVVLSKVLYGSVSVRAYDWVVPPDPNCTSRKRGLASVTVNDRVLDAKSPVSVLFPTSGGNMHTFTALTPCAILDVLSPPYSEDEGRPSTYFSEIPIPSVKGFVILEETEDHVPEDLVVVGEQYCGPKIQVDEEDDQYC